MPRADVHGNKHHFRDHLIPETNEGLDVGMTGQRFGTGRFASIIVDTITALTATITTIVSTTITTLTATTVTITNALTLSFLGAGYVKTDSSGVVSVEAAVDLASTDVTGTLPIGKGGTGAAALASGYIKSNGSVLSSQSVPIPVADGGTNAITAAAARTSLGVAPLDPTFVTLSTNAELSNERVLTAGTGISVTDAGAGSTVTIAATGGSLANPIAAQVYGG